MACKHGGQHILQKNFINHCFTFDPDEIKIGQKSKDMVEEINENTLCEITRINTVEDKIEEEVEPMIKRSFILNDGRTKPYEVELQWIAKTDLWLSYLITAADRKSAKSIEKQVFERRNSLHIVKLVEIKGRERTDECPS